MTTRYTRVRTHITDRTSPLHRATIALLMSLCLVLGTVTSMAQGEPFVATVDRTAIALNETVTLQLTLSGAGLSNSQPSFPTMDDWHVLANSQSSHYSIVNGKRSSQIVYTYQMQPMRTGDLVIPAISIDSGGQAYQSRPITVVVATSADSENSDENEAQPSTSTANQSLFVQARVNNDHPYLGEQIVYSFELYQAVRLSGQPHLSWPEWTGFLVLDLGTNEQYQTEVDGQSYLVTVVRKALFPTDADLLTIPPATLSIPGDLFNQGFELKTNSVDVSVRPLPGGAPSGFTGTVGQFEIDAQVDPAETTVSEPINLTVRVQGKGNINALADPLGDQADQWQGWRLFAPEITTNTQVQNDRITGQRQFERPLVPQSAGTMAVPAIALDYFDPDAQEYRHVQTEPIVVQVAESTGDDGAIIIHGGNQQDIAVLRADIRHIKAAPASLAVREQSPWRRGSYWLLGALAPLGVLGAWLFSFRQKRLAGNRTGTRSLRAYRIARHSLSRARQVIEQEPDVAYAIATEALTGYVADKINVSASGLVRDEISRALRAHGTPEQAITDFSRLLDATDLARFAPSGSRAHTEQLLGEAERVLAALEEALT